VPPPESRVVIVEGTYALHERVRSLVDLAISVSGGVHFDLVKRIFRGTAHTTISSLFGPIGLAAEGTMFRLKWQRMNFAPSSSSFLPRYPTHRTGTAGGYTANHRNSLPHVQGKCVFVFTLLRSLCIASLGHSINLISERRPS
jgi:hypothetical protein